MFVVDSSGSIRHSRFLMVIDYIKSVVAELEVAEDKVRVGIITFSTSAQIQFHLNNCFR